MAFSLPKLPTVPGTDPERCVFDSFRISIAKTLSDALPLTLEDAYSGVDFGKKGVDFTVALPRFRLPGKTDELAAKTIGKVELMRRTIYDLTHFPSLKPTNGSSLSYTINSSSTFNSTPIPSSERFLHKFIN
jgi:hypothetical protein